MIDIQPAIEVVELMLQRPREEPVPGDADGRPRRSRPVTIARSRAGRRAVEAGDRQAALEVRLLPSRATMTGD